ncbi:hypothetical protein L596_030462 [Steinernema carpocapsae]|uniref:Uncharacterized protein n=1 Tax=Steinernema carpocapsae TaxID=34508 RepID=A0A4U5LPG0_STECR|nr:hypothetical protein L596_030462 [Steinernema carpocapsae]
MVVMILLGTLFVTNCGACFHNPYNGENKTVVTSYRKERAESIVNVTDFEKLLENKLEKLHGSCYCYLVVGVTFKYTEISQKLMGDTEGSKTVATLSECAQFAYESNGVAIQLKQKDQSFTCVVYKNVKYVENGRNPPYQYFIADLRVQESCSAHVETVKSVTSEVSQCSVNQVICDKLKKVRTRPLCPKDPQPDDRCCPEDHTGACFEELTITYGSCIYADTHNPYSVAIAKMEGTKLYWITDFVNIPGEAKVLTRKAVSTILHLFKKKLKISACRNNESSTGRSHTCGYRL